MDAEYIVGLHWLGLQVDDVLMFLMERPPGSNGAPSVCIEACCTVTRIGFPRGLHGQAGVTHIALCLIALLLSVLQ